MVNNFIRCANKAAESASARLCADAEAETTATDVSSVAEATQPVSLGDAGAGHEDTHVFTEYELGVSYSPDTEDGSVAKSLLKFCTRIGGHTFKAPLTGGKGGHETRRSNTEVEDDLNGISEPIQPSFD
uniref:Uncharacterized protein n=1 Tax=Peronospora matthiolae TaxID=2874970 RepID=A0AAV1U0B5_9STRA